MNFFKNAGGALAHRVTLAGQPPGRLAEIYDLADDAHLVELADRVAALDACFAAPDGAFAAEALPGLLRRASGLALTGSYATGSRLRGAGALVDALRAAAARAGSGGATPAAWAQLAANLERSGGDIACANAVLVTARDDGPPPWYELLLLVAEPADEAGRGQADREWRLRAFVLAAALEAVP